MLTHPLAERLRGLGMAAMRPIPSSRCKAIPPPPTSRARTGSACCFDREVTARDNKRLGRRLGEWWLAGDARPWQPAAVNVLSDKLVFRPRLTPAAGRAPRHP